MNYFLERDIRRVVLSTDNSVDISDLSRLTNKTLLHSKQVRHKKLKATNVFLNEYLRTSSFKSTECEVQRSCDDISECFHYDYYYGGPKSCARSKHFTKCSAVCNNVEKNHTFAEHVFTTVAFTITGMSPWGTHDQTQIVPSMLGILDSLPSCVRYHFLSHKLCYAR